MKLVASLLVRARGDSQPRWPEGVERLIVLVLQIDPTDNTLVAYAIARPKGRGRSQVLSAARLPPVELGNFMQAVVDGEIMITRDGGDAAAAFECRPGITWLADPEPPPEHHNMVLTHASVLDEDHRRAEEDALRAARQPEGQGS